MNASSDPLFDEAISRLKSNARLKSNPPAEVPQDGFLFSGNRHESVPRALFFDRRLTPLERNAWQVCRMRLSGDGITIMPTYEQLRPLLTSMPCGSLASHETVARALRVLRLTRWLSLVRRHCRDRRTGRLLGNLYVLHDEPLTPYEAIQLDPGYLTLVSQALSHSAKSVQRVGIQALREMNDDPQLAGKVLPSRLHILMQRLRESGTCQDKTYPQARGRHDSEESHYESEESSKSLLRNRKPPASESEEGRIPRPSRASTIPKKERTVRTIPRTDYIKEVRTVPRAREPDLQLPRRFLELKEKQQAGVMIALQQADETQRQAVLDEWDARCRRSAVRNPAGYLFGIVQKAIRGEFKAWAARNAGNGQKQAEIPRKTDDTKPAGPESVQAHLERLHAILHRPGSGP